LYTEGAVRYILIIWWTLETLTMQEGKKRLTVIQPSDAGNRVVDGTTCFAIHAQAKVDCQRKRCPHWINFSEGHNCVHIAAQNGPHTLQRIGQIYGLTRMRICQIEKAIFEKIRKVS
jgi:hypothetical protein